MNDISVYICDNYGALRDLMRFALEDDPRVKVIGEAEDAITCVRELPEARPDVLVLDLREVSFFDSTGLQLVLDADVRAREEGRTFIVLAGHGEPRRVLELAEVTDRLNLQE